MADGCKIASDPILLSRADQFTVEMRKTDIWTGTVNNARAMRVAEIMNDFRNLQYYLSNIQVTPSAQDYYLEGYVMLRSCVAEAQGVLASPYSYTSQHPQGDPEAEKVQLQG